MTTEQLADNNVPKRRTRSDKGSHRRGHHDLSNAAAAAFLAVRDLPTEEAQKVLIAVGVLKGVRLLASTEK